LASAIRGALAFIISATADTVGTIMDRQKMMKWFEAVTEFKAYLDMSGVGDELQEAIYKPLSCADVCSTMSRFSMIVKKS
jgi:hypothetical protein